MSPRKYCTIYISGLPAHMTASDLTEMCRPFGEIVAARVEHDPETGAPWPFGFVQFQAEDSALRAAADLHGKKYRGDVLAAQAVCRDEDDDGAASESA